MRSSIWRGTLSFGLINIPVTVQSAEQDRNLHFNMLDRRNLAPIKFKRVNAKTGHEVPYGKIVKGYAYESGKYIIMSDEDFKKANPKATQTIDIRDFVKLEDIDLLMFERPYYLVPQRGGEKGYFLLQEALAKSNKVAIATVVMHTKEHLTCIFSRGKYLILEIMRFAHSIRNVDEAKYLSIKPTDLKIQPNEVRMAEKLINEMTSRWNPSQYKDTYYNDLTKHIQQRIKAGKGKTIDQGEDSPHSEKIKATQSKDLMALLKASLEDQSHPARKHVLKNRASHRSMH